MQKTNRNKKALTIMRFTYKKNCTLILAATVAQSNNFNLSSICGQVQHCTLTLAATVAQSNNVL